jgi:diguanylate cyclase (GGDEF)-like protein
VSPVRDDDGDISGAVEIFNEKSDRSEDLSYLEKIKKQTFIDPVTRVGNRKYSQVNLNNRYAEMKLHHVLFGILFARIDFLKKVENRHGKRVADRILEMSAKSIKSCLKSVDTVGRWDEERFIVIIPNIQELSDLNQFAERIRKFIENSWLHVGSSIVRVTASVGGTLSRKGDGLSSLLERAEKLTDKAKQRGGNQCNIA